ncbi:MAG TPA: FKBP-type peptidyl-prolyl cis-trans isomerase [Alphaproteobacteria bacterium]|nr:FKBP-type peptidyl-prolyl cis-trans isomerase [Alphaproteobacteria bacterium]
MKKFMSVFAVIGSLFVGACDASDSAKKGDTVVIDFAGFLNGEQFEGGTAKSFPLKLGSGTFVPGFEDQLIGAKKGEERDVNVTFPKQYYPNLAGKDVVFKVKVIDIVKE